MFYITYDKETGLVDSTAFSAESMIPTGRAFLCVTEEEWNAAQGKMMKVEDGKFIYRDFPSTKQELSEFLYKLKCSSAYNGIEVRKDEIAYIFETDKDSITMCNSQAIALSAMQDKTEIEWKVYKDNFPVLLQLTKNQFLQIFAFGMQMINSSFAVEGVLNKQVSEMTEEALQDEEKIEEFKATAFSEFSKINHQFVLTTIEE